MTAETESKGTPTPDNILFDLYERYIGEPETETDVYLGFGLFFAGVAVGAIALLSFVGTVSLYGYRETGGYYSAVQVPYTLAFLSMPVTMLSIVVLLPVKRKAMYGAAVGTVVAVVATVGFVVSYPEQWAEGNPGRMLAVVGSYAVGFSIVVAAAAAALIAHQIQKAGESGTSAGAEEETETDEEISMERVEEDIESAMEDVDMNLGGVRKTENKKLSFNNDFSDQEMKGGSVEPERKVGSGVDAQVEGLRSMKSGESKTETSDETVDDQAAALNDIQVATEGEIETGGVDSTETDESPSVVTWVLDRLGLGERG